MWEFVTKYGMSKQAIENGYQVEKPDDWLKDGNPFEIKRPEYAVEVKFDGYVAIRKDENGKDKFVQEKLSECSCRTMIAPQLVIRICG